MIASTTRPCSLKIVQKIVHCRDYIRFSNDDYRKYLLQTLSLENINTNSKDLEKIIQICINQMAPRKNKYVRGNGVHFGFFKRTHKKW